LGADDDLKVLNVRAGEQRQPAYLAINPMGKVPAITHGEALVTEQAAIFIYLADLYPKAGLAPPIGSPLRGPYLRWLVYYGNCFEPALMDKVRNVPPGQPSQNPYGDYDTMLNTLTAPLRKGPYISWASRSPPPTSCGASPLPGPPCSSSSPNFPRSCPTSPASTSARASR
jgi:glutathione S-transferase